MILRCFLVWALTGRHEYSPNMGNSSTAQRRGPTTGRPPVAPAKKGGRATAEDRRRAQEAKQHNEANLHDPATQLPYELSVSIFDLAIAHNISCTTTTTLSNVPSAWPCLGCCQTCRKRIDHALRLPDRESRRGEIVIGLEMRGIARRNSAADAETSVFFLACSASDCTTRSAVPLI